MKPHNSIRLLCVATLMATISLQPACGHRGIVGKWKWVSGNCNQGTLYPGKLEFFSNGEYVGEMPYLNGGHYSVVDSQRIKLDTVIGPRVYEFEIVEDVLRLKGDSDCSFSYERSS
jgi:hypothetical protein